MKYIDADKIRTEIARLREDYLNRSYTFVPVAMEHLLDFLDTLEEEPVSEDLGEEIERASKRYLEVSYAKLARIAKRFAEWGAEHLAETSKMISEDLEEAAEEYRRETCNKACKNGFLDNHPSPSIKTAFIAGAEWQKEQMIHVSDCLEDEVKNYFQGLWPDTTTAEGCNATMSFTAPAILRLIKHFTYWQYQKDRAEFAKLKAREWINGYNEGLLAKGKEDEK